MKTLNKILSLLTMVILCGSLVFVVNTCSKCSKEMDSLQRSFSRVEENQVKTTPYRYSWENKTDNKEQELDYGETEAYIYSKKYQDCIEMVQIPNQNWSIGKYEITQGQYSFIMGGNPSKHNGGTSLPVENVSWHDAMTFCKKLTERERAAGRLGKNYQYTLPTYSQWELACRAGTSTRFCSGDSTINLKEVAWFSDNSGYKTHPVGTKKPNAWGIYDMHGNVWEWCLKHPNRDSIPNRGGSYRNSPGSCESSHEDYDSPDMRLSSLGFRVVCVPVGETGSGEIYDFIQEFK